MHTQQNEPCIGCGRSTGAGTRFFSDRRTTRDPSGTAHHLCGDCNERAISHYGRRLTDSDMVRIAARGAGLGMAHGHGGMASGAGG
jgi:hypothetical protein